MKVFPAPHEEPVRNVSPCGKKCAGTCHTATEEEPSRSLLSVFQRVS